MGLEGELEDRASAATGWRPRERLSAAVVESSDERDRSENHAIAFWSHALANGRPCDAARTLPNWHAVSREAEAVSRETFPTASAWALTGWSAMSRIHRGAPVSYGSTIRRRGRRASGRMLLPENTVTCSISSLISPWLRDFRDVANEARRFLNLPLFDFRASPKSRSSSGAAWVTSSSGTAPICDVAADRGNSHGALSAAPWNYGGAPLRQSASSAALLLLRA